MFKKILSQWFCKHNHISVLGEKCAKCGKKLNVWDLF